MSNHVLDEMAGSGLWDLLPYQDQDISWLLDSLWCCLVALDGPIHRNQCLGHPECACTHWPHEAGQCRAGGTRPAQRLNGSEVLIHVPNNRKSTVG